MAHSLETLPPLDTLRAFEAAARAGSFSAAASTLNLTHGAISRRIARLEGWLGLRVFERQARGIALTPEGQRLFQRTQEAFALIADTSDRWSEPRGPAVVRVNSMPSVCSLWLMPRVARFEAGDPPLRVILLIDQRTVDLADMGVDLAIRCGRGGLPGRISVKLFEEWCFPIAAPDLARRIGAGDAGAAAGGASDPRFRRLRLAHLVRGPWPGLSAAPAGPPVRGLQSGAGCRRLRPRHRAGAPAAGARADGDRPAGPGRSADGRSIRSSYWLDRPNGAIRGAAATLAKRIAEEAEHETGCPAPAS